MLPPEEKVVKEMKERTRKGSFQASSTYEEAVVKQMKGLETSGFQARVKRGKLVKEMKEWTPDGRCSGQDEEAKL
jgi:hypothetical protein